MGCYRTSGRDSLFFHVYTNVEFPCGPPEARRTGVAVTLVLDAPPIPAAHDKDAKSDMNTGTYSSPSSSSLIALVVVSRGSVMCISRRYVLWSEHCRVLKS